MQKTNLVKFILFIILILFINNVCYSEVKEKVQTVVEEFPNYIFHLQTLGKIVPEDPEYYSLYQDSVSSEDRAYLYQYRNLLAWGNGNDGPLTKFFLFIPGYINLKSQTAINEYFDLLSKALQTGDLDRFTTKYNVYLQKMTLIFGPRDLQSDLKSIVQYKEIVFNIGEIYKRNYQFYHQSVWPKESAKLEKTAKTINTELQKHDLINRWEKLTGLKFKTDSYQIILFTANKNGPSANSLGYDRNAFYYNQNTDSMIQFIGHEVGTHLLIDELYQVMEMKRFGALDVYQAFENLAEFYTVKFILKGQPLYGYDLERYFQIYSDLYHSNPNISPKDLLIKGLDVYHKSFD